MSIKTFAFAGGGFGLLAFLTVALLPSIVYGGFAGAALAATILGEPIHGQLISKGLIVFGMMMGLLSTAGIFVVFGSAIGAGIHYLAKLSPVKLIRKT